MRYYRVHTDETAWITKQPRGLFTAVGKLVDAGMLSEKEEKDYWKNREYFERILPVPPYYEQGNPEGAITWYKDTKEANRIFHEMSFYRRMAEKYGIPLLGQIPLVQGIREGGDSGEPSALSTRPDALAFLDLARSLAKAAG